MLVFSAVSDDEMPPIPGVAGVDFPVLTEIPQTGFDCAAQDFPGIYADMDADCQVSSSFYMSYLTIKYRYKLLVEDCCLSGTLVK